ncbi:MAG: sigma-70 family RNA polymerase sigma factor [Chloroflexi bacterium]|nr:sigma-70 family RNA polymerase sigma factor [Chloroflexota bacterium]
MNLLHHSSLSHSSHIEQLYERYWRTILTSIRQHILSKEEAEDVLLEVFLAALENPSLLKLGEQQQLAWLRRVAYNKCIDYHRQSARHPLVSLEKASGTLDDDGRSPEQMTLRQEELTLLRKRFSSLPELQQKVLSLRFAEGLPCAEIAIRLQKSEGAIRTLLSRTLTLLRGIYEKRQEDTDHE